MRMRRLLRWTLLAMVVVGLRSLPDSSTPTVQAADRLPCAKEPYRLERTLANGARWAMCWEERAREGIVLRAIQYTPRNGTPHYVMSQANMAQLFVPYDPGTPRFYDMSDIGLGGGNMASLQPSECPGGTLLQNNGRNVICVLIQPAGYGYLSYGTFKSASALQLWSVSELGAYNYIVRWTFYDDGTIEPAVGATGQIQMCTSDSRYGWPISGVARCTGASNLATSHIHSYSWRLDFDLDDLNNNTVEQIEFAGSGTSQRPINMTSILTEDFRDVSPETFRSWRVRNTVQTNSDGHALSYELIPDSNHLFRGPSSEPWTHHDLWVTQYNACEMWLSHNQTSGGCGSSVVQYVNGETITDPVLWYTMSFHHLVRDEDDPHMAPHWSSYILLPRDLHATQPR